MGQVRLPIGVLGEGTGDQVLGEVVGAGFSTVQTLGETGTDNPTRKELHCLVSPAVLLKRGSRVGVHLGQWIKVHCRLWSSKHASEVTVTTVHRNRDELRYRGVMAASQGVPKVSGRYQVHRMREAGLAEILQDAPQQGQRPHLGVLLVLEVFQAKRFRAPSTSTPLAAAVSVPLADLAMDRMLLK